MPDEIFYADLNILAEPNRGRQLRPARHFNASQNSSHWHQIGFWSGWAGTIILLVTVTMLARSQDAYSDNLYSYRANRRAQAKPTLSRKSVLGGSFHKGQSAVCLNATEEERECPQVLPERSPCSEDVTHLKSRLCDPTTGSSECKLCPVNWVSQKGKCYWFSKGTKDWSRAQDHCLKKGADMLLIQDEEEKEFIQNSIYGAKNHFWIGLKFLRPRKKWIWIDDSLLDETLLSLPVPKNEKACGALKDNLSRSEMCSDEFQWICEKEAVVI